MANIPLTSVLLVYELALKTYRNSPTCSDVSQTTHSTSHPNCCTAFANLLIVSNAARSSFVEHRISIGPRFCTHSTHYSEPSKAHCKLSYVCPMNKSITFAVNILMKNHVFDTCKNQSDTLSVLFEIQISIIAWLYYRVFQYDMSLNLNKILMPIRNIDHTIPTLLSNDTIMTHW